jgi:hypothetical protein
MSDWPDPEKPGVPLNSEVDGFHWLGNAAFVWAAKFENWALNGMGFPPEFFATTPYLGPCLTPAEADALRAEADALRAENARMRAAIHLNTDLNAVRAALGSYGQKERRAKALSELAEMDADLLDIDPEMKP